jgi:uncharacterized protein (TIGR03437 family)
VPVLGAQPGIFILDAGGSGAVRLNGSVSGAGNGVTPGEVIVIFLTGMGSVSNPPAAGTPASLTTLSPTVLDPQVVIGGFNAAVGFSGLSPGFISMYQINVTVPDAVPSGTVDVTVESNSVRSNVAKLTVR